ncbi:glycine oxidase ThiO [Bacillus swezeyi]|uniref:glycine oxidase n=1 Tax=Bacillus swezeyi TaxID=1925020 RepID=A0A5M8S544_9BACI|nr:glycine oxidase ThiO [Bacillus swezeyi]KAA6453282.1 glycine oxidase ThiO [Bacillus swezeyi]TYS38655.1 glycine oxidase ThiO [Bacillus swezeyi]
MKKRYETVVVGGGIIGASIAYHLAKAGIKTAVFESGEIGQKATRAAAGMLGAHAECDKPGTFFEFARASQKAYQRLEAELKQISGIDIRRRDGGIIKLAFSKSDRERLMQMAVLDSAEWLTPGEVFEKEPYAAKGILGANFIQDDVHVEPVSVCRAFAKGAKLSGADIFEYTPVTSIETGPGAVTVKTASGEAEAEHAVIASGVWSGVFFKQLGLNKRFYPVKGECLSVWNEGIPLNRTLYHDHCYIVPRHSGKLVVGATMKPGDWNEQPELGGIEAVIKKAKTMLPEIEKMKIDQCWAGLRPETEDGNPYIGRHPENGRILFAAGHFRNGILLAPATGAMITDMILGRPVKKTWEEAFQAERKEAVNR